MTVGELKEKLKRMDDSKEIRIHGVYASEGDIEKVYEENEEVIFVSDIMSG